MGDGVRNTNSFSADMQELIRISEETLNEIKAHRQAQVGPYTHMDLSNDEITASLPFTLGPGRSLAIVGNSPIYGPGALVYGSINISRPETDIVLDLDDSILKIEFFPSLITGNEALAPVPPGLHGMMTRVDPANSRYTCVFSIGAASELTFYKTIKININNLGTQNSIVSGVHFHFKLYKHLAAIRDKIS